MPKLRKVKVTENSLTWYDIKLIYQGRNILISIPKRELETKLKKGKTPKKIILELS